MRHGKAILKTIIACAVIYILFKICTLFLMPFLLGLLISILIEPIIKLLMGRLHMNRTISMVIALLLFCSITFAIVYYFIYSIYKEIIVFLKNAPYLYEMYRESVQRFYIFLENNFNIDILKNNITALNPDKMLYGIINLLVSLKNGIIQTLNSFPDIIIYITFSIIASFFISRDKKIILNLSGKYLPKYIVDIASKLYRSTINIVKAECILVGISILQAYIGFLLLNNNYAILLSILCGILDILPVVGPGIIFLPWIIYCLLSKNILYGVSLLCLFIIMIVTRQVLETRMISGKLNVHPLIILISIYIGLKFFGVIGALLGPLITVILKEIYEENICKEYINE